MEKLQQRRWFVRKTFEISERGVKLHERTFLNTFETVIPFEEISNKEVITTTKRGGWLGVASLFLVVAIILAIIASQVNVDRGGIFFWLVGAIFCYVMFLFSRKSIRILEGLNGRHLIFLNDTSRKGELDEFIKIIFQSRKEYLLAKYMTSGFDPDEKLRVLRNLFENNVIDGDEYKKEKDRMVDRPLAGFKG